MAVAEGTNLVSAKDDVEPGGPASLVQSVVPAALCALLGVIFSTQEYFRSARSGEPISWVAAFVDLMPFWLFWALLSPLIAWLSRRYPFGKGRWSRSLLAHLSGSVLVASLYPLLYILLSAANSFRLSSPQIPGWLHFYFFINAHVFGIIIYWIILTMILTLNYYRRFQEQRLSAVRLEAQLKDAQLRALRMQLHPHFLFNALHSVTALVLKNDNVEAVRMISRLSELLRLAIKDNDTQWVPLKQELQFIDRYLDIERIRFQDRLTVKMNIEPETLDAAVPNLILQPLVENAIRHGIAVLSSAGTITVSANRQGEELHLEVSDDGPGLPPDWPKAGEEGLGLKNIQARLEQLYGSRNHFSLSNINGRGTVATIKLPFHPAKITSTA